MDYNAIKELIQDIESGVSTEFSSKDMNDGLRKAFFEIIGKENPSYKDFRRHKELFEVMEEFIQNRINYALEAELSFIAEIKNQAWGDTTQFELENPDLFNVAVIARGNGNLQRQRLENGFLNVPTEAEGIKIYDNFKRFLSGRVDWSAMVNKVANSFIKNTKEKVWTAFYGFAPANGDSTYNVNDAGGFAIQSVDDMIDHVSAENGGVPVMIVGTRQAVKNLPTEISSALLAEQAKLELHQDGFIRTYEGTEVTVLDQMHVGNTDDFLLSNKQLLILPMTNEKMVKIVIEGEAIIEDFALNTRGDMSKEYMYYEESGVGVVTSTKYGKYTWA